MEKLPQNLFCHPFSMAKTFSAPHYFRRGKTSLAPPLTFCSPTPIPVISDHSLLYLKKTNLSSARNIFLLQKRTMKLTMQLD